MKFIRFIAFLFSILFTCPLSAQISHGGEPLFARNNTDNDLLRNSMIIPFMEMPTFDVDSALYIDEYNRENMRGNFTFAHKFFTKIKKGVDGNQFTLDDGTKVWQVGIRSEGAYSINLLFTQFHLPKGGRLFIYNKDYSHIIGSFTEKNNTPAQILPIRPVAGEAIIVEYSEPADAEFEGVLEIGEVNHDFLGILRAEPLADPSGSDCMIDVLCEDVDEELLRSTVMLIINGTITCSGSLINNTENDGAPYLLTAVHCFNQTLSPQNDQYYIDKAGTVIAFFNYNRPICGTSARGTEEMSLASSTPRIIMENKDLALLEFQEKPPVHYNVYYAGWNVDGGNSNSPYTNIHHPKGAVKKMGIRNGNLSLSTPSLSGQTFDNLSHWRVASWNVGSTYGGSSGSPLFDNNNLIVGGLSGGSSVCSGTNPGSGNDYFFALHKAWLDTDYSLQSYLNPKEKNVNQWQGFDPHANRPVMRISNANFNDGDTPITTQRNDKSGYLFGSNTSGITEFAEEFNLNYSSELLGTYLILPKVSNISSGNIEVRVYSGTSSPETLLASQIFRPQYLNYSSGNFSSKDKTTSIITENFIKFDDAVSVDKKFFIAYKINNPSSTNFAVYNTEFGSSQANSAWIKEDNTWTKASNYSQAINTSLAIHPVLRYTEEVSIPKKPHATKEFIFNRSNNQLQSSVDLEQNARVSIYSVSGQVIESQVIDKGCRIVQLSPQPKGTLALVRIVTNEDSYSLKIVY